MRKLSVLLLMLLLSISFIHAQAEDEEESNITIAGGGHIMFGQIVSGHAFGKFEKNLVTTQWQNFYSGRINITSKPNEWFTAIICPEVSSSFPVTATSSIMKETYKLQYRPGLPKAVGIFDFEFDGIGLNIETGIMEYNFNPDIKNLGNYIYRSSAYPLTIRTNIDYPFANLVGIHPEVRFLDNQLKIGSILNTITTQAPFNDISLGFFGSYTAESKLFDIGAGICFDRVFSVDDTLTDVIDARRNMTDSTLTLRSTKIDFRASIDPKQLLGLEDLFGPNDAKFYFEAALIGIKDHDYYPDDTLVKADLMHRLPILFGFNIPTFNILDYLNIEVEYCAYPYAFDWWGGVNGAPTPMPSRPTDEEWALNYREKDNWKMSLYLKKSFSKFDIIALAANDHKFYDTYNAEAQPATEQSLRTPKDWHWYIKLQYNL